MAEEITATFVVPTKAYCRVSRELLRGVQPGAGYYLAVGLVWGVAVLVFLALPQALTPAVLPMVGDRNLALAIVIGVCAVLLVVLFVLLRRFSTAAAQRRIARHLKLEENPVTFSADAEGMQWYDAGKMRTTLTWAGIERVMIVDGHLVFVSGLSGLMVPTDVLGPEWRHWLRSIMERLTPEARAASQQELRDAVLPGSPR